MALPPDVQRLLELSAQFDSDPLSLLGREFEELVRLAPATETLALARRRQTAQDDCLTAAGLGNAALGVLAEMFAPVVHEAIDAARTALQTQIDALKQQNADLRDRLLVLEADQAARLPTPAAS